MLFCWWRGCDSFNSAGLHLCKLPKRQHLKVVRHAKRVAVFSKQPNPPLFAYKTAHLAMCCFAGGEGAIRLIAQGCTCANCPSVSTERWFDTQSVRLFFFEKQPNPPLSHTKKHILRCAVLLVERGGFEPPKSLTTDLQSAPFGHSGTSPYGAGDRNRTNNLLITNQLLCLLSYTSILSCWCLGADSNHRHRDFQSLALPPELPRHLGFQSPYLVLWQ